MNVIVLATLFENLWIALVLFAFVWVYSWAKNNLGSAKLAVLFAALIVFLTFYSEPGLVWIGVALFILATFGKDLFDKVNIFKK